VVTFQKQGGCALRPATEQAATGWQAVTTAGLPPGQKLPMGQAAALLEVEPAAQPKPAAAVQAVQVLEEAWALK
jgi:hypothetical protein